MSSEFLHMGEEPDLVPSHTVFFSGCTFNCVYCQNWDISTRPDSGRRVEPIELARTLERRLPRDGEGRTAIDSQSQARNVNWVGGEPTPNLAYMLQVLKETRSNLPQNWNSNMYMSDGAMELLDGTVDVLLADLKYGNDDCARRYSKVDDYFRVATRNHKLEAKHADLLVRHLMLPGHLECCTLPVLGWLAKNVPDAAVNIMDQYRPMHLAHEHLELMARVSHEEHQAAVRHATDLGLSML